MMLNPDHPTAVLRDAWRHVRLDDIRAAARATIVELENGTRAALLLQHESGRAPSSTFSATARALWVCCNEVRTESGLAEVGQGIAVPNRGADPAWDSLYSSELERYRTLAGQALMRRLIPPS
ncbi:MAG: hypothetical protein OXU20_21680 [Myxococcales bacterium]|nr:hypothetical protein [Myxococcales bacterium]MDD9966980.1 hypothetical protein [Myxococcales bacterium]